MEWTNLHKALEEFARDFRNAYQDRLIRSDRIASGKLLNSVEYMVNKNGTSFSISLELEDYWIYVEDDTRPHFPPLDKIREWIKVKPVLPRAINGKLPTENQLAYLIGRKISRVGTKGSHDLEETINSLENQFDDRIGEAIEQDIMAAIEF